MRLFGFGKKMVKPSNIWVVRKVFNSKFDVVPIDNFFMKTLKLYHGNEYVGSMEYSDVIVDDMLNNNIDVIDETLDISRLIPKRGRVLGEVEFQ